MISMMITGCSQAPEATDSSAPALSGSATTPTPSNIAIPAASTSFDSMDGIGYISLDVNPSVQLSIKGGVVLSVTAYNDDGEKIVLSTDVVGMTYKTAVDKLIGALNDGGYLSTTDTTPSIVITTYGDVDDEVINTVEAQANESLNTLGVTCPVYASDVSDDKADVAKSYGLTPGRYLLIDALAQNEGLTIEEAIAKYAHMRMGDLTQLLGDAIGLFGDQSPLYEGLTDEQIAILDAAKDAYSAAMNAAAQAYHDAKAAAIDAFKSDKEAAQAAYKAAKDQDAWQQAKDAAIQAFNQAKDAAKSAFDDAKASAKADFLAAIASLNLDPSLVESLLAWNFDYDWNYDYNWGGMPGDEDNPESSPSAKPSDKPENKPSTAPDNNQERPDKSEHSDNGNKPGNDKKS
jgi:hypothetical protein